MAEFKIGHSVPLAWRLAVAESNKRRAKGLDIKKMKMTQVWNKMISRCYDKNDTAYKWYGGRGIKVSEEWLDKKNFVRDMGNSFQFGLTLERINNNVGYLKENCRWATRKEQANNRKSNHLITFNGSTKTLAQWAEYIGIKKSTLFMRLYYGWSIEKTLTKGVNFYGL